MYVKYRLLLLMLTCFYGFCSAQPNKIYLKNISLIYGDINFLGKDSIAVQLKSNRIWIKSADVYRLAVRSDGHEEGELQISDSLNNQQFLKRVEKLPR